LKSAPFEPERFLNKGRCLCVFSKVGQIPPPSSRRIWAQHKKQGGTARLQNQRVIISGEIADPHAQEATHFLPANTSHNGNGVSCVFCPAAAGGMDTRQGVHTTPPINHSRPPQKDRSLGRDLKEA
jgi:hypothetical protein